VPIAVADALLAGEHPMRVWREYRRMTQDQLAQAAGVRRAHIAQLGDTPTLADPTVVDDLVDNRMNR